MKGNIQKQMEEITENHPNSEKERIGEEQNGGHIPIITQRARRGEETRTGLTSSGAVLTAARRHKSALTHRRRRCEKLCRGIHTMSGKKRNKSVEGRRLRSCKKRGLKQMEQPRTAMMNETRETVLKT